MVKTSTSMAEPGAPAAYALPRDTLIARGPDRKSWLDGLLTNKVADVTGGSAGYGLLLTKQGKIVTDAFLLDTGSELFVGVASGRGRAVRELLDRYLVMEDAELAEAEGATSWYLAPQGSALPAGTVASGRLALGGLQAELGIGGESSGLPSAAELLAVHGLGVFGVDFSEQDNPHEASLDRLAVCWTKGCYLGQEVVCMQDMRGKVKRRLVAFDASAALLEPAAGRAEVTGPDGSVAGQVTSVHASAAGTRVLASISTAALEARVPLEVRGQPLCAVSAPSPS
jgi:folate-binding protein YgfZ